MGYPERCRITTPMRYPAPYCPRGTLGCEASHVDDVRPAPAISSTVDGGPAFTPLAPGQTATVNGPGPANCHDCRSAAPCELHQSAPKRTTTRPLFASLSDGASPTENFQRMSDLYDAIRRRAIELMGLGFEFVVEAHGGYRTYPARLEERPEGDGGLER